MNINFKILSITLIFTLTTSLIFFNSSAISSDWCYEKNTIPPNGMFGRFNDKQRTASKKINKIFKFNKEKLPERPASMLQGLAYLEILVNEMCFTRNNPTLDESRKKIEKIANNIRESLGMPLDFSRKQMIDIYWSTNKLLQSAKIKKTKISQEKKEIINLLRKTKASLKLALKEERNND